MKTKVFFFLILWVPAMTVFAQKPSLSLIFTAISNNEHVVLDSVLIKNLTQACDTTLHAPDTLLLLTYPDNTEDYFSTGSKGFFLFQNYPNPIQEKSTVCLFIPGHEKVSLTVSDALGRELLSQAFTPGRGYHTFTFYPSREHIYFLTASLKGQNRTIKMFNNPSGNNFSGSCRLEHNNSLPGNRPYKDGTYLGSFIYNLGDSLQFKAYSSAITEIITDKPAGDSTYLFDFKDPCSCLKFITYEGQVYNTRAIGLQCWLRENLNAGIMVDGSQSQSDDGLTEKYCYGNDPANCEDYGGLYQWNEAMAYSDSAGTQGICPAGWHIPTDQDWKVLEGFADSYYGYPVPAWDETGWRGHNVGKNLKFSYGWNSGGNGTDEFGFGALPDGMLHAFAFSGLLDYGRWWTSDEYSATYAWSRILHYSFDQSNRSGFLKTDGYSVRCIKNGIPVAAFTAFPLSGLAPMPVSFQDLSTNKPDSWLWDFGDGESSTLQNPTHTYDSIGEFTVKLTVTNTYGSETKVIVNHIKILGGPCPGIPTFEYGGQVYNTVKIGSQCWFKENLNVGTMTVGTQTNNGIMEKFCYYDDPAKCAIYGGLYSSDEMMNYSSRPGTMGICPKGWHIPTDEEWKELEGAADSYYGYPDPVWDETGYRGFDVGITLKSETGWSYNGNGTDQFGFSALPGGLKSPDSSFMRIGRYAAWWTSGHNGYQRVGRSLDYYNSGSYRNNYESYHFSVRCLKDSKAPVADFSANLTMGVAPLEVSFYDLSTYTTTSWHWDFGDGQTSELQNPIHVYDTSGYFTVKYVVTNALGSDTAIKTNYIEAISPNVTVEPCPGLPTITYEGQVYNTVQIGSQCWLRENLNAGTMINSSYFQNDNGILEKYCYDDDPANCAIYGGLYQWPETMAHTTTPGVQGICPPGWHVPTDEEWKELEGAVDTHYDYPDSEWNAIGYRGFNSGWMLKAVDGWNGTGNGGSDLYGFRALPGGYHYRNVGEFFLMGTDSFWWTSNTALQQSAWQRSVGEENMNSCRNYGERLDAKSVRCLKDE